MSTPNHPMRSGDFNQLTYQLVRESTAETGQSVTSTLDILQPEPDEQAEQVETVSPESAEPEKNPHAVALSKLRASERVNARAWKMTAKLRSESPRKAARARRAKKNG
jgi:hypothetical protein